MLDLGPARARVLYTGDEVRDRIGQIGRSLRGRLGDETPVFVGLLHAGFVFLADLIRAFDAPHEIDFLKVSRYDPLHREPTAVRVLMDLRGEVRGRTVVVVEAIRAHGTKIEYVERFLRLHGPSRIVYCALVVPAHANRSVPIDEAGFFLAGEAAGRGVGGAEPDGEPEGTPRGNPGHRPGGGRAGTDSFRPAGSAGEETTTVDLAGTGPSGSGYVIGYGLDYRERFRHLDCIAALATQPLEPVFARGVA